jgi:hypothetical protein
MVESDFYSSLDLKDIVLKELERERENQLEDALLVLISRCFHALLLRKAIRKFLALLIKLNQEDWAQKEPQELENCSVFQKLKDKKLEMSPL